MAIPSRPGLPVFLSLMDGARSYGEIAAAMECPVEALLNWAIPLQSLYLVE